MHVVQFSEMRLYFDFSILWMGYNDGRMTIGELFGDENLENENTKNRPIDMLKNMDKKILKWEKEEQESPDSGFADEISDQNREQFHRP